jgi:hypothetical protein
MVLTKDAREGALYILKFKTELLGKKGVVDSVSLVRLRGIGWYGGRSFASLERLIELEPRYEEILSSNMDNTHPWSDLFYLNHKGIRDSVKLLYKNPKLVLDFVFGKRLR